MVGSPSGRCPSRDWTRGEHSHIEVETRWFRRALPRSKADSIPEVPTCWNESTRASNCPFMTSPSFLFWECPPHSFKSILTCIKRPWRTLPTRLCDTSFSTLYHNYSCTFSTSPQTVMPPRQDFCPIHLCHPVTQLTAPHGVSAQWMSVSEEMVGGAVLVEGSQQDWRGTQCS